MSIHVYTQYSNLLACPCSICKPHSPEPHRKIVENGKVDNRDKEIAESDKDRNLLGKQALRKNRFMGEGEFYDDK